LVDYLPPVVSLVLITWPDSPDLPTVYLTEEDIALNIVRHSNIPGELPVAKSAFHGRSRWRRRGLDDIGHLI
jgi:hypothetical protein